MNECEVIMFREATRKSLLVLVVSLVPYFAQAQTWLWTDRMPAQDSQQPSLVAKPSSDANASAKPGTRAQTTIPAGTRILMVLRSPVHTTSGTEGSGLYLVTLYPVVQDNQIVIPAHTQVQGVVERDQRPGHIQRNAEFRFCFTTIIFPNNHVASIDGALQSIPGSATTRVQRNDGTLQTVDQNQKVATPTAIGAVSGAVLGSVHHTGIGTYVGAGLGAGLGLGSVLLKRGDDINLPRGTNVEMVLEKPLILESDQAAFNAQYVPPAGSEPATKDERSDSEPQRREKSRRARPLSPVYGLPWLLR